MTNWTEWETLDHRVVLSGRVADSADQPVGNVELTAEHLSVSPKSGSSESGQDLAKEGRARIGTRRARSRADGLYYFLDLPAGEYRLRLQGDNSKVVQEKRISLRVETEGIVRSKTVNFSIE